MKKLQEARAQWVENMLSSNIQRDSCWTESIATGDQEFVEGVKEKLGMRAKAREVIQQSEGFVLKEPTASYRASFDGKKCVLRGDNSVFLGEYRGFIMSCLGPTRLKLLLVELEALLEVR